MRRSLAIMLLGATSLLASGCLHPHVSTPRKVVKIHHKHHDSTIVIVHPKPAKHRH